MKYFWLLSLLFLASACKKDLRLASDSGFPGPVNTIIQTRCATEGCHTNQSKEAAGGLSLETWDDLMKGSSGGAIVIPYRSNRSLLQFYVNTFEDLGVILHPTMPYQREALSRDEVLMLRNWIDNGAPNENGLVAFSDDVNRSKFYVTNQGCDEVAVVDAKSLLVMRYISVGVSEAIESPHAVKVAPDGNFAYVTLALGTAIQKINCQTDQVVGTLDVGFGLWNSMVVSADGKRGVIADWQIDGRLIIVDLQNMVIIKEFSGIQNGHGLSATPDFNIIYCTNQPGHQLYRIDITDLNNPDLTTVSLGSNALDPHDILFSPDGSKYFVTCQSSNDLRVFQTSNDSLLAVIPTGDYPQELAISTTKPYLFVTCLEEPSTSPKTKGSVNVFNYNTFELVKTLQDQLFQPHGVAVDDKDGIVLVSNRNLETTGPAPHHTTDCAGRSGFLRAIDLNTLEFISAYRPEVSVDPYGIASRVVW